jgi:TfoX/Sxy family transcriptional regulator of competence genes
MAAMKWTKSPESLVRTFAEALPDAPSVERRSMFGYPCAFVNGNMFAGLHQASLILRLGETERGELLREPGARIFEPMPGRPMKEYVAAPPRVLGNVALLRKWMQKSLAFAASLPPKGEKPAKAKPRAAAKAPAKRAAKKKT